MMGIAPRSVPQISSGLREVVSMCQDRVCAARHRTAARPDSSPHVQEVAERTAEWFVGEELDVVVAAIAALAPTPSRNSFIAF